MSGKAGSEPVETRPREPSAFQPTRAAPTPVLLPIAQLIGRPAAPVVALSAGYQQGMGQVVGESVNQVGTVAVQGKPMRSPASSLPEA